jgi:hypothetical protein
MDSPSAIPLWFARPPEGRGEELENQSRLSTRVLGPRSCVMKKGDEGCEMDDTRMA